MFHSRCTALVIFHLPTSVSWYYLCMTSRYSFSYCNTRNCNIKSPLLTPFRNRKSKKLLYYAFCAPNLIYYAFCVSPNSIVCFRLWFFKIHIFRSHVWISESFFIDRKKLRSNWFKNLVVISSLKCICNLPHFPRATFSLSFYLHFLNFSF